MAIPNETFSRRSRTDLMTPAEIVIQNAVFEVEMMGAALELTDVVTMLGKAKGLLSDFIDKK